MNRQVIRRLLIGLPAAILALAISTPAVASPTASPSCAGNRAAAKAYVTSTVSTSVTVINARGRSAGHIDVGTDQQEAALSDNGQLLFVALDQEDVIAVVNTSTRRVVATMALPSFFGIRGMTVLPGSHKLYVANRYGERVTVVDTGTLRELAVIPTENHAIDVAAVARQHRVYVGTYGLLQIIDTRTDKVVRTIWTGTTAAAVAIDPRTDRAFITGLEDPFTVVVDITTGARHILDTNWRDVAVAPALHRAFLTIGSGVDVLDTRSLHRVGHINIPQADRIVLSADGARGYVTGPDRLTIFNPYTLRVLSTVKLAAPPAAVAAR